jgi:hypothetical protein
MAGDSADGQAVTSEEPHGLGELLDRIETAAEAHERPSVDDVLNAIGPHSFTPFLLLPGMVMMAPGPGDVPGVPVLMGLIVLTAAVQLIVRRRDHFWLPAWVLRRNVSADKVCTAVRWSRKVAPFVDRWTRPRLRWAVEHLGFYLIALSSALIAMGTPVMEFVPFSANVAGIAIFAFGIALLTRDGLVASAAFLFTLAAFALIARALLGN